MTKGEIIASGEFKFIKLDKKDEEIIHELVKNCRTPASVIANKWDMRKENVLYRIDKLFKKGIIVDTYTAFNVKRLGYSIYNVYLRTKNLSKEKEEEMIQFLIKHPYVSWVITASGRWDIIIQIFSKTTDLFNDVLMEIENEFGRFLLEYSFFIVVEFHHFVHTYIDEKKKEVLRHDSSFAKELISVKEFEKADIDDKDIEIMQLLADDARLSLTEIGKRTGLSSDAVSYRIKKLIGQGIVQRFSILRNKLLLGYQFYSLLLKLKDNDKIKLEGFLDFSRDNEHINVATRQIGKYNYILDIDCKSNLEFKALLDKIKELFGEIIEEYEATIQFHQRYFTYLPSGIVQDLRHYLLKGQHNP